MDRIGLINFKMRRYISVPAADSHRSYRYVLISFGGNYNNYNRL